MKKKQTDKTTVKKSKRKPIAWGSPRYFSEDRQVRFDYYRWLKSRMDMDCP